MCLKPTRAACACNVHISYVRLLAMCPIVDGYMRSYKACY
jgi:hypothetical protein